MLTELDQIANQNHLQLVKAVIPYLPAGRQRTVSVLIKMLEMQNILQFYRGNELTVSACSAQEENPPDLLDVLTGIRAYCEGAEKDMVDQILQTMSMVELYSMFSQPEGNASAPDY